MSSETGAGGPPAAAGPISGSNFIGGRWVPIPGEVLVSRNPAWPAQVVYACGPVAGHVDQAVLAARGALGAWAGVEREKRFAVLRRYGQIAKEQQGAMSGLLCDEIGKVMWECKGEASILSGKVDITLDQAPEGGLRRVSDFELSLSPTRTGRCLFKPHGVVGVIGPFNFPAHLPNGHIVPALAMGNTVVFKPSDKAPGVGELLVRWFDRAISEEFGAEAGRFAGVINLVQGKADVAGELVRHAGLDAVAFTGSWPVARKIAEANLDRPGLVLAFELGGNNPAVVMPGADLKLAAIEVVRSAFNTTGQRCTCTRRLIVHEAVAGRLVPLVCKLASNLIVGDPRATHPVFMGPINSEAARAAVLEAQARWERCGGRVLVRSSAVATLAGGWYVTPGVVEVERFVASEDAGEAGADVEVFGPLLRVCVVRSLDEAIAQANATRYGLAASVFTPDEGEGRRFINEVRAGCINVNAGTAGASSKLPFGGLGLSGNHRPAGSFALDYCVYPVASMVETSTAIAPSEGMRWDDAWLG
jgi:succinylglutamic semialdehyde dehydrogenase